jgi:hypothetical protein
VGRVDIEPGLGPTRRPGALVIRGTLRAPKAADLHEAISQTGARRQSLPPSSLARSPLERC